MDVTCSCKVQGCCQGEGQVIFEGGNNVVIQLECQQCTSINLIELTEDPTDEADPRGVEETERGPQAAV